MKYALRYSIIILCMQGTYAAENENINQKLQARDGSNNRIYTFDARALFGGRNQDIDLTSFRQTNGVAAGVYSLNTSINNHRSLGQLTLKFDHLNAELTAVLCIDEKLLKRLDLRPEVLEKLLKKPCLTIKELNPDAYYDLDMSALSLDISLPLAIINQRPEGYIAPERFEQGVTAAYIGYDFNRYTSKLNQQEQVSSNYLNLTGGFNFSRFNFRHAGSFDSDGMQLGGYQSYLNVLSTDIPALEARLEMGDFNTQTYAIDSAQIRGLQLASDISMLPMSQRSYAPLIRGLANTNALVSVFQNGRKIYERTVPAGEFEFNDLTAVNNNGDLTVQVTENGGEKHSFIVPMQGNMNLVRMGQLNYNIASGQYKINNKTSDDYIGQLSAEYGLSNYSSLYLGSNLSHVFQSYLFGFGQNTRLGGLRFDAEKSNSTLAKNDYAGWRYKAAYQYSYSPLNTFLNVSAQYQDREYMTLSSTMSLRNFNDLNQAEIDSLFLTYLLKQQFNISLYQNFKEGFGSVYLNATQNKYWNTDKDYVQYSINYSNRWNRLSYSIGYSQNNNQLNDFGKENKVYLSFSLPLEWRKKQANLYSNIQYADNVGHPTTANVGLTGTLGENNQFNYGLTTTQNWNNGKNNSAVSANMNYSLPQIQLGAVTGWSDDQTQYGFSAKGAIVAHPYGITATNNLSDTFTIVHAKGAHGADVVNAWGSKIDYWGNAIYANVSPYEANTIRLDTKHLPLDVNLTANQAEVIPRRYSSTLIKFDVEQSSNILLNVQVKGEHQQIPIGVQAVNQAGQVAGMFGQSNQLFIEKAQLLKQDLYVQWGMSESYTCRIDAQEKLLPKSKQSNRIQMIDVECK
jgi:outer membrane usher protein